jgi:hypothetical protein
MSFPDAAMENATTGLAALPRKISQRPKNAQINQERQKDVDCRTRLMKQENNQRYPAHTYEIDWIRPGMMTIGKMYS